MVSQLTGDGAGMTAAATRSGELFSKNPAATVSGSTSPDAAALACEAWVAEVSPGSVVTNDLELIPKASTIHRAIQRNPGESPIASEVTATASGAHSSISGAKHTSATALCGAKQLQPPSPPPPTTNRTGTSTLPRSASHPAMASRSTHSTNLPEQKVVGQVSTSHRVIDQPPHTSITQHPVLPSNAADLFWGLVEQPINSQPQLSCRDHAMSTLVHATSTLIHVSPNVAVPSMAGVLKPPPLVPPLGLDSLQKRVRFLPGEVSHEWVASADTDSDAAAAPRAKLSSSQSKQKRARSGAATGPSCESPTGPLVAIKHPTAPRPASPDELPLNLHEASKQTSEKPCTPSKKRARVSMSATPCATEAQPSHAGAHVSEKVPPVTLGTPLKSILKRTSSICDASPCNVCGDITRACGHSGSHLSLNAGMWLGGPSSKTSGGALEGGPQQPPAVGVAGKVSPGSRKRIRRGKNHDGQQVEGAMSVLLPTALRRAEAERQAAAAAVSTGATTSSTHDMGARAIVFSAFWHHLLLVQQQLMSAGVRSAVRPLSFCFLFNDIAIHIEE